MITYQQPKNYDDIPSLSEQKASIMTNFNFKLVEMVMRMPVQYEYNDNGIVDDTYHTWKMYHNDGFRYSTEKDLKELASKLLDDCITHYNEKHANLIWIGTGPFKAFCRYGILELMFVLEAWHCD